MAIELLGYTREIHGHLLTAVGQLQTQAEAQRAEARQREEMQRAEAQALRTEALKRDENNLAREQMLIQTNAEREKVLVETNAVLLKEKMRADLQKDMEFQRSQKKERDRAIATCY